MGWCLLPPRALGQMVTPMRALVQCCRCACLVGFMRDNALGILTSSASTCREPLSPPATVQLRRALKILGVDMTQEETEFLINDIDANGDGEVRWAAQCSICVR